MGAGDAPVFFDREIVLEVEQEVVGRHRAAVEKIACDPVRGIFALKVVGEFAVGEDVHEQLAARAEPAGDLCHEALVVFHVLEHFHGDNAVECRVAGLEVVHVRRDDADIAQTTPCGFGFDVEFLGRRI